MSEAIFPAARPQEGESCRAGKMKTSSFSLGAVTKSERIATWLYVAAALLWLPQAGLIAFVIGQVAANGRLQTIVWPVAGFLILGIIRSVAEALGSRRAFLNARAMVSRLRETAVATLAARSPLDRDRTPSGYAASVISEQADTLVPYLSRYRLARARVMIVPPTILAAVLACSWTAAIILLVAAPLIPIFMILIGWRAKAASEAHLAELGNLNAFLLDRLRGLTTIRSFDAVDATARRLRSNAEELRHRTMAVLRIAFLSSAVLELFAALGVALVAVYIGFHLLGELPFGAWGAKLTLSEGLFILLLAPAFFDPLRELSAVWHDRAAGEAAIEALDTFSARGMPVLGKSPSSDEPPPRRSGAIGLRLDHLGFRHSGSDQTGIDHLSLFHHHSLFQDLSLAISPGEHVAILGPSGAGKSTLLALIAGLAPVTSGEILFDGTPMTANSAPHLRQRIAWIGQRSHLFEGSLAKNITLSRPTIDQSMITHALHIAALDELAHAPHHLALGEGGTGLSGGEGLRLALARGAANPDVGLILADEPTAHLDAATAAEITKRLLHYAAEKTLIIATHDPVLAARMTRIIRLDDMQAGGTS